MTLGSSYYSCLQHISLHDSLKVKSHRFSFFHRPGYHTFCLDDYELFGSSSSAKRVVLTKPSGNEERVIQFSDDLKEPKELKDLDQHAETYQVRQPILTKLTRHCRTLWFFLSSFFLLSSPSSTRSLSRGVNRRTDRRILEIFLPGFRIQSEILTDFRILQLQRNADSSIFWARILDFACNTNIFAPISDSGGKFIGGFG